MKKKLVLSVKFVVLPGTFHMKLEGITLKRTRLNVAQNVALVILWMIVRVVDVKMNQVVIE